MYFTNFPMKKAIFLDRDGTLNFDSIDAYKLEDLRVLPWVAQWLHRLKAAGYLLIIISNQSSIGRWLCTYEDFLRFTNAIADDVGIQFDAIYCCPHKKDEGCPCRKPKIQQLIQAQQKFSINFSQSYFIGDKDTDMQCGRTAGCRTIFLWQDVHVQSDFQVFDFADAVKCVVGE